MVMVNKRFATGRHKKTPGVGDQTGPNKKRKKIIIKAPRFGRKKTRRPVLGVCDAHALRRQKWINS